jgi:hypothetical protein
VQTPPVRNSFNAMQTNGYQHSADHRRSYDAMPAAIQASFRVIMRAIAPRRDLVANRLGIDCSHHLQL